MPYIHQIRNYRGGAGHRAASLQAASQAELQREYEPHESGRECASFELDGDQPATHFQGEAATAGQQSVLQKRGRRRSE